MVAVSRLQFENAVKLHTCQFLVHPNETSCTTAALTLVYVVLKGSFKYYVIMYGAQNALKYKSLSTADIKPILVSFVRSLAFAVWAVASYGATLCLWKNLTGKFNHDLVAYWAALISGIGLYFDDPKRRPIVSYTLSAVAVEALIRRLYTVINRHETVETLIFMTLNGILMYKMRTTDLARFSRDIWFFRAPRLKRDKVIEDTINCDTGETIINACPHAETACTSQQCFEDVVKETAKYVGGATIFTAAKLLLTHQSLRRNPLGLFSKLLQWKHMKLAVFFGWYVGIFKGINCFLCRMNKADSAEYALLGGILAGISYRFNMNLTILSSIILYVARILGRELQERYQYRKYHFIEITGILAIIVLINTRIFAPECCPSGFHFIVNTITNRRFDKVLTQFSTLLAKEIHSTK